MANVKISQLTTTTTADDGSWLVMNDSGNTTTYKITRQNLLAGTDIAGGFIQGDASHSLVPYYFPTSAATVANTTYVDKLHLTGQTILATGGLIVGGDNTSTITPAFTRNAILNSYNSTITSTNSDSNNTIIGGYNADITSNSSIVGTVIGSNGDLTVSSGLYNGIYSCWTGLINNGNANSIFGGNNITISSSGNYNSVVAGQSNTITQGNKNFAGGGTSNSLQSGDNKASVGGASNTLQGNNSSQLGSTSVSFTSNDNGVAVGAHTGTLRNSNGLGLGIFGGNNNRLFGAYMNYCYIYGGANNTLEVNNTAWIDERYVYGTMVGGYGNKVINRAQNNTGNAEFPLVIGGKSNKILADASEDNILNGIINSSGSTITTGRQNMIIGSNLSTVSGTTRAVMLGTDNRAALYDDTTHTENSHTFKTESFNVIAGGNVGGTVDVDCSLGTIYTFTLTANTTPNFINLRTGQRFIFIVDNTTYNVPTATINGVSGNVYAKNGTIAISNNAVTKYTATFDGTRMFLDEELNFTAV